MKYLILINSSVTSQEVAGWLEKCEAERKPFILVIHKGEQQGKCAVELRKLYAGHGKYLKGK